MKPKLYTLNQRKENYLDKLKEDKKAKTKKSILFILGILFISLICFAVATTYPGQTKNFIANSSTYLGHTNVSSPVVQVYNETWLNFDEVNDYVIIPSLNLTSNYNYSICFGFNTINNTGGGDYGMIFSNGKLKLYRHLNSISVDDGIDGSMSYLPFFNSFFRDFCFNIYASGYSVGFIESNYLNNKSIGLRENGTQFSTIGNEFPSLSNYLNNSLKYFTVFNKSITPHEMSYLSGKSGGDIPFISFHGINDSLSSSSSYVVNISQFNTTLNWFFEHNYSSITVKDYYLWTKGLKNISEKSFVITFDDGLISDLYIAFPIMQEYGFVGTSFIITSLVGNTTSSSIFYNQNFMNWSDINYLYNHGWEIASHGNIHANYVSTLINSSSRILDLNTSILNLKGNISGYIPFTFAYPFYARNLTTDLDVALFFNCSLSSSSTFLNNYFPSNYYSLSRYSVLNNDTVIFNLTNILKYFELSSFNLINYNSSILVNFQFNENNGTIAYDSSGNGNNGTISGATWQNDGILKTLVQNVDYSLDSATGVLSLLDNSYLYSWLMTTFDYSNNIIIESPLPQTYTNNLIDFNITLDEEGDTCYSSLDGASNVSMTKTGVNSKFESLQVNVPDGSHNVLFSCNDTSGNWGTNSVSFVARYILPTDEAGKFWDDFFNAFAAKTTMTFLFLIIMVGVLLLVIFKIKLGNQTAHV